MQIHRIVAGLSLDKLSDQAIRRAMSLAREYGARLDVVHGAGVEAPYVGKARHAFFTEHRARALERAREAARGKLELLVEDPVYAELPLDDYLQVRPESGARALLSFAEEHGADLLVIGAHRHRKPFDLGGTGRAALAKSACPVWAEPAEGRRFERVLAPVDLSPWTPLVLEAARSVAQRFHVPVRVLHAFVPPDFAYAEGGVAVGPVYAIEGLRESERAATAELVAAFDWGELPTETEFAEGDAADAIVKTAGETDLIVMGTHGHSGLARAVLGSCANRVLRHAHGPVLVVPDREHPEARAG
jgi:nucleotide-binding universal stress UspA family protein